MANIDNRPSAPAYAEKLAYLESLEVESPQDQRDRKLGKRVWTSLWPKVLAIVIVLAIWQLIHVSGWKKEIFPGPGATLANLGISLRPACCGTRSGPRCSAQSSASAWP